MSVAPVDKRTEQRMAAWRARIVTAGGERRGERGAHRLQTLGEVVAEAHPHVLADELLGIHPAPVHHPGA